jgi:hypothetical protein
LDPSTCFPLRIIRDSLVEDIIRLHAHRTSDTYGIYRMNAFIA